MINRFLILSAPALLLTGCAADHGDGPTPDRPNPAAVPVEFYISVPQPADTRVGDPGSPTGEAVDWDRIAVIVAYTSKSASDEGYDSDPKKMVYWDTFSRSEFEQQTEVSHPNSTLTPIFDGTTDTGVRTFTMPLPTGTARVYGITYSSPDEAANDACKDHLVDFEAAYLEQVAKDGNDHNADILAWTIPNSYATTDGTVATMDVGKFLSVATGYAVNTKEGASSPYDLTIVKANDIEMKQYWSMTLRRLATKLDVQWDAQSAYDNTKNNYVDVQMDGFTYDGGASLADGGMGSGLLFPYSAIQSAGKTFPPLGGKVTFYNTTPISKRNGRVYHYIFPDYNNTSATPAKIEFRLTTTTTSTDADGNDTSSTSARQYSYNFQNVAPLLPATWYKINTKVKGNTQANTEIVIDQFNTGN